LVDAFDAGQFGRLQRCFEIAFGNA
jgi:hypothetical protein